MCYGPGVRVAGLIAAGLVLAPTGLRAEPPRTVAVAIAGLPPGSRDAEALATELRAALSGRAGLELLGPDDEAWAFRSVRPVRRRDPASLTRAKELLAAAEGALARFDLGAAVKSVAKAKADLAPWVGLRAAVELDRARIQLAVSIAHAQRDEAQLDAALREHATRHPGDEPPRGLWPPDVTKRLAAIRGERPTALTVRTTPRAVVFVDGRELGPSPVRAGALPPGRHVIEVEAPGYFPVEEALDVTGEREGVLDVVLAPDLSEVLATSSLDAPVPSALVERIRALALRRPIDTVVLAARAPGGVVLRRVDVGAAPAPGAAELARAPRTRDGLGVAIATLFDPPAPIASTAPAPSGAPTLAWITAGAGVALVGAGLALRMFAVSTASELEAQRGALTQVEAYGLRDRMDAQALGGALLIGAGVAALGGGAAWIAAGGAE